MTHVVVCTLCLGGFALLLMAMARHQQDWLRRKLTAPVSRGLRWTGFGLLAFAFLHAGSRLSWGYGVVVWFGWLTRASLAVVSVQNNRERIMRKVRR
jgi:hypothetical protein